MATVSELSKKYSSQLSQLQAIFPEWDEGDLVFALQDSKGNVEETVLAISEGRASQFTQATKKKAPKTTSTKAHGGRNDAGWDNVDSFSGGRGGRSGGRGGRGGAVAGRGGQALRGARVGRAGARGGRGGYGNVNGGGSTKVPAEGSGPEWPTTTATSADGWSSQVEQAEAASAHEEDDGGWGEPAKPEVPSKPTWADLAKGEDKSKAAGGAWGSKPKKAAPAPSEKPAAAAPPAPAPSAAPVAAVEKPVEKPAEPAAPAAPAAPAKKTWAQIAKPVEKPKPVPPPAPKAPEPEPKTEAAEEEVAEPEPEAAPEAVEEESAPVEEAAAEPEPEVVAEEAVEEEEEEVVAEPEAAAPAEPEPAAAAEEWVDPAIASATATAPAPAAAPEPVTTYTGPPGFNTTAAKAVPQQNNSRTNSRAAQRYKNADGQAVVLPASAGSWGAAGVELQFGSLSFGGRDGDGVEAPVPAEPVAQPEAAPATSPVRTTQQPIPAAVAQPAAPQAAAPPSSYYGQQQAPQQPAGFPPSQTLQQQYQAYQSYGQQQQQPAQAQATQEPAPQQQQQQQQQSQYGAYRQQDYYGSQQQQQPQQAESQAPQQQQQQQQQPHQPQQLSYDSAGFGGFGQGQQLFGQPAAQHNDYGQNRNFDSYSSGYPRPPAEEPKQAAPAPSHTPSAPAQPQQNLPHQQHQQYYSTLGNMGYYQSGPYNPYYQYGQAPNPGFQQYYPMASRNLYGQPAPQVPPAPIPASKPTPPAHHSPYGAPPSSYPSSGFDDQSFGLGGRYGDANKAGAPQSGAAQGQQNPQPIGGSIPQSYPSQQQGIHSFLGGNNTSSTSLGSGQPARQAGTPDDNFKAQPGAAGSAPAAAGRTQPQQPQAAQQGFNSYPYGGYQNHDWSPYGQQQQHYSGSRNGGYAGWQQ